MSLIKKILKRLLPTPLLKTAFLTYNKIKILTFDRLIFPEFKVPPGDFLIFRVGYPFRENGITLDDLPADDVKMKMGEWYDWTQEEFLLKFDRKCWIEPGFGWAIVNSNKLLYYSIGVSRTWFQRKPDVLKLIWKGKVVEMDKVISLRDSGEENYFHFYNDILSKLHFLMEHGIAVTSLPIIVSHKLWQKSYFQYYLSKSSFMRSLNWVRQEHQYIRCKAAIFCKPITHRVDLWKLILEPIRLKNTSNRQRKVFLTRNKSRMRFIENSDEIHAISHERGFEVVDADGLSSFQQVELFSQASFIVGIHGAGLTNMVFSNADCKILELFPPPEAGYLPYHYILLAKMRGFQYRGLVCEQAKMSYSGGFYVGPARFLKALIDFSA